jgi:hypothetical protein
MTCEILTCEQVLSFSLRFYCQQTFEYHFLLILISDFVGLSAANDENRHALLFHSVSFLFKWDLFFSIDLK